ncbi:MAG: hypothetical protein ABWZ15_02815 [Acidimicrobiia bacterium]
MPHADDAPFQCLRCGKAAFIDFDGCAYHGTPGAHDYDADADAGHVALELDAEE